MKYYKIRLGFDEAKYIEITEEELPKALVMFLTGSGRGVFEDGAAIRGQDIIRIEPDWHREKGWNKGWKMTPDDYADIKPLERGYQHVFNHAKSLIEFLIQNNQTQLASQPLSKLNAMNLLPEKTIFSEHIKSLSDSMRVQPQEDSKERFLGRL